MTPTTNARTQRPALTLVSDTPAPRSLTRFNTARALGLLAAVAFSVAVWLGLLTAAGHALAFVGTLL